jgi:hypothetical protein
MNGNDGVTDGGAPDPDLLPIEDVRLDAIGDSLSPRVRMLLASSPKIRDLFHGVGLNPFDREGQPQDCSSEGYDRRLLEALVKKGVDDPTELSAALNFRPDGEARKKGRNYIERCVADVLGSNESSGDAGPDFVVDRIVLFDQRPTRYELTIEGRIFKVTTAELMSRGKFAHRFADEVRRIPRLPGKKEWPDFVNALIARAERVEMPPEASLEPAKKESIERIIEGLHVGDDLTDLDAGKAFKPDAGPYAGVNTFKSRTVVKLLREEFPTADGGEVCTLLKELGYQSMQVGPKRTRVWGRTPENARAGEKNETPDA